MLDCKQDLAVNSRCRNYLVTRKVENCRTQINSPSSIVLYLDNIKIERDIFFKTPYNTQIISGIPHYYTNVKIYVF